MKKLIRSIKFYIFVCVIAIAINFLPDDAIETWTWIRKMPNEE